MLIKNAFITFFLTHQKIGTILCLHQTAQSEIYNRSRKSCICLQRLCNSVFSHTKLETTTTTKSRYRKEESEKQPFIFVSSRKDLEYHFISNIKDKDKDEKYAKNSVKYNQVGSCCYQTRRCRWDLVDDDDDSHSSFHYVRPRKTFPRCWDFR
jgi:hypothetical protein